ncbi:MAG TPA: universal stress protein [Candidatus Deferrimicrobiaceae bacterium]|jgi:nucleotide-binding universal stress UspA family protein|nr:universal stress protein [Candidatus Deferrimicrobiaceae bacterium]
MNANKILVPLDGSEMAEAAIAPAREMAQAGSSLLILMRAAVARTLPGTDVIDAQILAVREAEDYLAGLKEKLEKAGAGRIETHVWYGPAAPAIVEAAKVQKADVIVMSTHGRSGLGRIIFGSVAESVLRGTHVPIFLVRPSGAPVEPPAGQGEARPAEKTQPTKRTEALR